MTAHVELYIDELVLRGFAPGDPYRLGQAVERELTRLLAEEGAPTWLAEGGEVAALDGGTFEVAPGAKAEAVAAQVARAVYGGLKR